MKMTEKSAKFEKLSSSMVGSGTKPVPMKLFAAWEVDRTPSNCIPRLCSLTITRLSILTPMAGDMTNLSLAVKMQSSKRTLRSHEIPIAQCNTGSGSQAAAVNILSLQQQLQQQPQQSYNYHQGSPANSVGGVGGVGGGGAGSGAGILSHINSSGQSNNIGCAVGSVSGSGGQNNAIIGGSGGAGGSIGIGNSSSIVAITINNTPLAETELDLHFSLQYPHFIKRDGNRLVILLQRRKKYKSRTILGYKTLAEGIIRMDAVLQKSMDMTIELIATGKSGRPGTTVATLRAERVSSIPVDHDNKNNNSVLITDRIAEYSDEDEEGEFSSGEDNDDGGISGYDPKREYPPTKHELRKYRLAQRIQMDGDEVTLGTNPVDSDSEFEIKDKSSSRAKISRTISLQQRNFKQKIVALIKRFKVSEELDGSVARDAAALRGERELDALFQELESLSCGEADDSGPDLDSLSIGSTPKPSLRPFFSNSRNMLHENHTGDFGRRGSDKSETTSTIIDNKKTNSINNNISASPSDRGPDYRNDSSGNEGNTGNTDPEGQYSDPQNTGSPPREKELNTPSTSSIQQIPSSGSQTQQPTEKRSRLFRTSSNTPSSKTKKQSLSLSAEPKSVLETCLSPTNVEPRKLLLDQLSKVFSTDETILPDVVTIISPPEAIGNSLAPRLTTLFTTTFRPAFLPQNTAEVKAVLQALMTKIQKYCNSNAKPPTTVKLLLLGGDWLQGAALRHYVELLGVRPPDWVHHLRFYIVPIGSSTISRHLSSIDQSYHIMFGTENWHQLCDRAANSVVASSSTSLVDQSSLNKSDIVELVNRIQRYLHTAGPCTQIPIAEAMVNYKDEDSRQIFVPFVSDVRIGYSEGPQSLDFEESSTQLHQQLISGSGLSSSPPLGGRNSPPTLPATPSQLNNHEPVELQVDYWPIIRHSDIKDKIISKGGDHGKNSIKSTFRNLQVWRLPQNPQIGEISNGLTLSFATKEKKQKIMRLGKKKEKDRDSEKEQCVEGVSRLICSPKQSHPVPLRVYIDGTEWTGVKFFQLSSQWQTHVKNFPIALIGCSPMSCSELS